MRGRLLKRNNGNMWYIVITILLIIIGLIVSVSLDKERQKPVTPNEKAYLGETAIKISNSIRKYGHLLEPEKDFFEFIIEDTRFKYRQILMKNKEDTDPDDILAIKVKRNGKDYYPLSELKIKEIRALVNKIQTQIYG